MGLVTEDAPKLRHGRTLALELAVDMPITRSFRTLTSAVLALAVVLLIAPGASAQSRGLGDKLDKFLRYRSRQLSGRTRVIVEFNGDTDVRIFGRRGAAVRRLGRNSQVAEVDNAELAILASNPRVKRVMHDRPTFATLERTGLSTGATLVRQQLGLTGKGVGVAVIDSGISSSHDDLYRTSPWSFSTTNGRVAHFKDFTVDIPNVWSPNAAYDDYGHGTHVAGIIAGTGYDSNGKHKGIAPGAKLVGLKVMDRFGRGYMSDVIAAIDYAISVKAAYNVRVINLSVASGVYESYWTDPLTLAAKRAVDAGIIVVASAGNLGQDELGHKQAGGITSPGNAPWVLTVGASSEQATSARSNDTIAKFSSRGPTWIDFSAKPDLVAPGVAIESLADSQSTLYYSLPGMLLSGASGLNLSYKPYLSLSGTSMAAPVVAGTVALMLEANPKLSPNAVKAILQYTAQVKPNTTALVQGAGVLNALGAVRLAKFFASPTNGVGNMGDTIQGEWVSWARHIIWGNYRLTGGIILPGSNAWSTSVRWGALKAPAGERVVWGARFDDNIVWSTASDDNIVWSTGGDDNIVWSTVGDDNIVWSTGGDDNIVWSTGSDDNIVWSTGDADNIVWSTGGDDNIVWSTGDTDNIVWSTGTLQNVVWGGDCGGRNCQKVVWGTQRDGIVMGTTSAHDNIVWSTASDDNIVWSTAGPENDNIVWSTSDDNIVWSTSDDNIVWSTSGDDNIVWSTGIDDEEVVGTDSGEELIEPVQ
jgi:serine protease AprX